MERKGWLVLACVVALGCGAADKYDKEHARGLLAIERSQLEEAEQHFRAALDHQDRPEGRLDLGRALVLRGKHDEAEAQFKSYVGGAGTDLAWLQVAQAWVVVRQPERARAWVADGIKRHPKSADLRAALGDVEMAEGAYPAALVAYRQALELALPKERDRHQVNLARAYLGETVKNLSAERERLGALKDWKAIHESLARLTREGKVAILPAMLALKRALYSNPENLEAHLLLGTVYHQLGRLEEAQLELEEAVRIAPRMGQARYVLGTLQHAQGALDEAAASYRAALERAPELREARVALGTLLAEKGQGREALAAMLEAGAEKMPDEAAELLARRLAAHPAAVEALIAGMEAEPAGSPGRRLAARLLARVSGQAHGEDPVRWRAWWKESKAKPAAQGPAEAAKGAPRDTPR